MKLNILDFLKYAEKFTDEKDFKSNEATAEQLFKLVSKNEAILKLFCEAVINTRQDLEQIKNILDLRLFKSL